MFCYVSIHIISARFQSAKYLPLLAVDLRTPPGGTS